MSGKIRSLFNFVRLLTVEPLAFFLLFIFMFKRLPLDQMVQDKICLQRYNLPAEYCQALPTMREEEDSRDMKSTILSDVTTFNLYANLLTTVPTLFIATMIGPFIDRYRPAKKILMVTSSLISLFECTVLCVNSLFFTLDYKFVFLSYIASALCGGPLVMISTIWSYLSSVTPPHLRSLRMVVIEIFVVAGPPVATAAGGNLLLLKTPFVGHEPRNFTALFIICGACSFLMLLISMLLVDEKKDRALFRQYFPAPDSELNEKEKNAQLDHRKVVDDEEEPAGEEGAFRILFDLNNIKDMFNTFVKPRRHNVRLHIVLIVFASMAMLLAYLGPGVFMYQYVQKAFDWNSSNYSNYSTVTSLINIVSMFVLAPLLIKVFKIEDLHLCLASYHLMLFQNIIRLLSKSLWTFYAVMPFYLINSFGMVGTRSYLTKIIEPNEVGRAFSLMSALDASLPLISSLIFTPIFRLTIDTYPNLSFAPICFGLFLGIVAIYVVSYQSKQTLKNIAIDRQANAVEKTHDLETIVA